MLLPSVSTNKQTIMAISRRQLAAQVLVNNFIILYSQEFLEVELTAHHFITVGAILSKLPPNKQAGNAGENLVAELLKANGWQIIATQWHCRWGELDIVARDQTWLLFVEVKTRSCHNWDESGLLAITTQKQRKLGRAALAFLKLHPDLANLDCRFDIALVQKTKTNTNDLSLKHYIEAGFSVENK
jgi:putative endonuclease